MLLHAGIADGRMWEPNRARLGTGRTLVVPDLRGFGRTTYGEGPYSNVDDVIELLDNLELPRVTLLGASFGGAVAVDVALTHPDRVEALVLAAPALGGWDWAADHVAFGEEEERLLDEGNLDAAVELNVRRWVDAGREPSAVDPAVRELVTAMQRRAFELDLDAYSREPVPGPERRLEPPAVGRVGEIGCPVLVVLGALDVPDMGAIGAHLAEGLEDVRTETVEGVAHLPSLEAPETFDVLVTGFLSRLGCQAQ